AFPPTPFLSRRLSRTPRTPDYYSPVSLRRQKFLRQGVKMDMDKKYEPRKEQADILDRAEEHIRSVPYRVTARWLFYRLLQDGIYHGKDAYLVATGQGSELL
ncbi:unnamed protein product, partial [marine sediment metagenome]